MATNVTLEQCEILALKMGRVGGFVEMSYRLFPETRNSFTPNFVDLGFDFQEMRQITLNTELRFQVFPTDVVAPLKKRLEEARNWLRAHDEGPFFYTGAAFLNHEQIQQFHTLVEQVRGEIRDTLREQVVDNYETLRQRAREELQTTFRTLLPRLGISNTSEVLSDASWFNEIFPSQGDLTGDFRLDVRVFNVHPVSILDDGRLRRQIESYLHHPRQLSLFNR